MAGRRGRGEGSIHRRQDGRWVGSIDLGFEGGKRVRKTVYGGTRQEVVDKLHNLLQTRREGLPIATRDTSLERFLAEWLETVRPTVREGTWQRYEAFVRLHITPTLGRTPLSKLTPQQVQRLYGERLRAGLSPTSVLHLHRVLHVALKQAVRWELTSRNVTDLVDPPRRSETKMCTLDPDETRRLLEAAAGTRFEALYVLAVTTGMREGELLALHWRDIELEQQLAHVRGTLRSQRGGGFTIAAPKTGRSRRQVHVSSLAADALKNHRVRQAAERLKAGSMWEDNDLVFSNEVGRPVNANNLLNRSFRPLLARAGLPRIRFHDLRHTAATLLLGRGMHPKIVSEMLGHSQISITLDLYSHVTPTMHKEAARTFDSLLS